MAQRLETAAPKTKFPPAGPVAVELVAKREAESRHCSADGGLFQRGVEIVRPLPHYLQDPARFTFGVGQTGHG